MFFVLSKIIAFLLKPLTWVILTGLIGIFWRKKFLPLSFGILLVFSNPYIINELYAWWEPAPSTIDKEIELAIVLTGMTIPQIQVPGQLQMGPGSERIIEALRLYHTGRVKKILISGGSGSLNSPELTESPALAKLSSDLAVAKEDIYIEDKSRNTYQNALFSRKLVDSLGIESNDLLLITSAFHMRRALACFKKQGLEPVLFPVDFNAYNQGNPKKIEPSSRALERWDQLLHEWFGIAAYKAAGYI